MITPQICVGAKVAFGVKEKRGSNRLFYSSINIYRGRVLQMPAPHTYFVEYDAWDHQNFTTIKMKKTITLQDIHSFKWGGVWVNNPNCKKEIKDIYP